MFGKKGWVKKTFYFLKRNYSRTWLIRTIRGNASVSVIRGLSEKKRPGHMLYWYKDYGRQRGRRVGTMTAAKSQPGSETFIAEKNIKWLHSTRVKRGKD